MATSIGGLRVSNPLQLSKTAAPKTTTTTTTAPKTTYQANEEFAAAYNSQPQLSQLGTLDYAPLLNSDGSVQEGSYGYGSSTYAPPPPPDPYAQWGGIDNYNKLVADWNTQKNTTFGSITDQIGSEGTRYGSSAQDFATTTGQGQRVLNDQIVQNELSKIYGTRGVQDMVGTGVKSAGVMLANRPGASTSSANEAVARAYSTIGGREMGKVGNQYASGQNKIASAQLNFDEQVAMGARHLEENKTTIINNIVSGAQTALADLNTQAATASLPERVNIENEKQRIKNEALANLQRYDSVVTEAKNAAKPMDSAAAQQKAYGQASAGAMAANPFQFTAETPAQFQNTGPFAADLPLFTLPGSTKKQTA